MASTITPATLAVTITEAVTLNGKSYGNINNLSVPNIAEVDQRIVTVPTSEVILLAYGTAVAAGTFIRANVAYLRITNKDDTNFVKIKVTPTADTPFYIQLQAGKSFELHNGNVEVATPWAAWDNIASISAIADTASVDVEYFIALT
jgi:hypothetical protein